MRFDGDCRDTSIRDSRFEPQNFHRRRPDDSPEGLLAHELREHPCVIFQLRLQSPDHEIKATIPLPDSLERARATPFVSMAASAPTAVQTELIKSVALECIP